ncbi:MAG TPA: hypothetical protein RMF84_04035 [Polyangiaceae bacterium LLY-WYZ-14_1]|nr:hypothetical protein [Polyangiaceae bacterium LLY-WYZ-14_1]
MSATPWSPPGPSPLLPGHAFPGGVGLALGLGLAAGLALVGCDEDEPETAAETEGPTIGLAELPIALRNAETRPTDALELAVSPQAIYLGDDQVLELEGGAVPDEERDGITLAKLASKLDAGPPRKTARVRMHVNVDYQTMALLLATLRAARVRRVAFEVRKPGPAMDTGWLVLDDFLVQPPADEPVAFEGGLQRRWQEFVGGWDAAYEACRSGEYVDCDRKPDQNLAEGGLVEVSLFTRGSALQAHFRRFGEADDAATRRADAPAPKMLEGIAPPEPGGADRVLRGPDGEPLPPTEHATFTWRYVEATQDDSSIASAFRPICGVTDCGLVTRADAGVPSFRMLSFIGAAFPDGTPAPRVVMELAPEG